LSFATQVACAPTSLPAREQEGHPAASMENSGNSGNSDIPPKSNTMKNF